MTDGKLCLLLISHVENSEHAQEPPTSVTNYNIPPVSDWWFLTSKY